MHPNQEIEPEFVISIESDGSAFTFLKKQELVELTNLSNSSSTRRASHVEPTKPILRRIFYALRKRFGDEGRIASFTRLWPCLWNVNLSPVNGPTYGPFSRRHDAIDFEVDWLNKYIL